MMRRMLAMAMAMAVAACGGVDGPAEGGPGGAGAGPSEGSGGSGGAPVLQSRVPLLWSGEGAAPKLGLVWQPILGLASGHAVQLLDVDATDLSALPEQGIEAPPDELLVPWDGDPYAIAKAFVIAVDDADGDGTFAWDGWNVRAPDRLVGVARHVLLFDVKGAGAPLVEGLHLGSLDYCGAGGARELRIDTLVRMDDAVDGLGPADLLVDACEVPSAALGTSGTGPCSADVQGAECGACNDAGYAACRDEACAGEGDALAACAQDAGCVAADGAWDAGCVMDACGTSYVGFDVCIAACWDPYDCF